MLEFQHGEELPEEGLGGERIWDGTVVEVRSRLLVQMEPLNKAPWFRRLSTQRPDIAGFSLSFKTLGISWKGHSTKTDLTNCEFALMIIFLAQGRRHKKRIFFFRFMIVKWSDCAILLDTEREENVIYIYYTHTHTYYTYIHVTHIHINIDELNLIF